MEISLGGFLPCFATSFLLPPPFGSRLSAQPSPPLGSSPDFPSVGAPVRLCTPVLQSDCLCLHNHTGWAKTCILCLSQCLAQRSPRKLVLNESNYNRKKKINNRRRGTSHCGLAEMNLTRIRSLRVRSLASLSGLRIWHCRELWCRSKMRPGSGVAVAVA